MGHSTSSGRNAAAASRFERADYADAEAIAKDAFKRAGAPEWIASGIAGAIARDREIGSGQDADTATFKVSKEERDAIRRAYNDVLEDLGYEGTITIRTRRVRGTRSRLRGIESKGATTETEIEYAYNKRRR